MSIHGIFPALSCPGKDKEAIEMENGMDHQKEFSTCLEDLPVVEAMKKRKNRRENESPFVPPADIEGKSEAAKRSVHMGRGIIESILNVHRCSDCPIRRRAFARPQSVFARIHCWHMTWWPGWKIHQEELRMGGDGATATTHSIEENL
jgi:hypothetical protein